MALNVAWTPVFFGLQAPGPRLVILLALWLAIVATMAAFDRVDRRAAVLLVPYLAWVTFAAVLNAAIWRLPAEKDRSAGCRLAVRRRATPGSSARRR